MCYRVGHEKVSVLGCIPYLFARLDEAGVRGEAFRQFDSAQPSAHHPVSLEFLGADSKLRPIIYNLPSGQCELPDVLKDAVASLRDIPLDGSVAEGPHASANRVGQATRAAKWPWLASTMGLDQIRRDRRTIPPGMGAVLKRGCRSWPSEVRNTLTGRHRALNTARPQARKNRSSSFGGSCSASSGWLCSQFRDWEWWRGRLIRGRGAKL